MIGESFRERSQRLPFLHFAAGVVQERRAVERRALTAVGRVAASVTNAFILVEDRCALYAGTTRFGRARVRTVRHVGPGQSATHDLQRSFVDHHLSEKRFIFTNVHL